MRADRGNRRDVTLDLIAVAPGCLAMLAVDEWLGVAFGLPAALAAIIVRRTLWVDRPFTGRLAVALLTPIVALTLASLIIDPGNSPMYAVLLALPLVGLVDAVARRSGHPLMSRFPLSSVVTLLVLATALGSLLMLSRVMRFDVTNLPRQVYMPPEPPRWTTASERQAFELVRKIAATRSADASKRMPALAAEPASPGIAVTFFRKDGVRKQGLAFGGACTIDDLRDATREAMAGCGEDWSSARIRIDLLGEPQPIKRRPYLHLFSTAQRTLKRFDMLGDLHHLTFEVEPGVDGVIVSNDGRSSTILPADQVSEGWLTPKVGSRPGKLRRTLRRAWNRDHGHPLDISGADAAEAQRFRVVSLVQLEPGAEPFALERSNPQNDGLLDRATVRAALDSAVTWLARQMGPDGAFHYETLPPHSVETKDYGIARHAGATYALLSFYLQTEDEPELAKTRERALDAALRGVVYAGHRSVAPAEKRHGSDLCFVKQDGAAPSGATALAAIAVALLPEPKHLDDPVLRSRIESVPVDVWLAGMGSCLLHMVDDDGAVFGDYQAAMQRERVGEERRFFPGEVMLSLVHLYRRTRDERYVEAARRIGERQLALNRVSLALDLPVNGDHWFAQSLAMLSEVTGDTRYAKLSLLIAQHYLLEQYPAGGGPEPDYRGAYLTPDLPSSNHAACRGEALGAAARAAKQLGVDVSDLEHGILEGTRFILSQQMTRELSYFVPDEFDVVGAFRMDPVNNHCRIDNNQHAIVALLAALETYN
ncbi:MAG: hypothetical protein JRF63_08475 [Deltaproteobacteria bacterium]|nr:hypothetical protein [Deltaproteobacteria bacterium]